MKNLLGRIVLASLVSVLAGNVSASIINLTASLDGAQAGTSSSGIGSATMTLDDVSNLFSWDISWSGLTGTESVMHFHGPALPGANAGIQVDFGAISGTMSPSIGSTIITNAQTSDLLAGLWYINIHTNTSPAGEIRGQVGVVPIPAALWLFGSGLLGLAGMARRKQSV